MSGERNKEDRKREHAQRRARYLKARARILNYEFGSDFEPEDFERGGNDIMGLLRGGVRKQLEQELEEGRKNRFQRRARFKVPAPRGSRPRTPDGRTSFHFSIEFISKTRAETTSANGTVNRPGAAAGHNRYIEREGAVAVLSVENAAPHELEADRAAPDEEAEQEGAPSASDHNRYVERQTALAVLPDGSRVLFTNISIDPAKRARFWDQVEEHERNPSPDQMTVDIGAAPDFWREAVDHPRCPLELRSAVKLAKGGKVTFETECNDDVHRFLSLLPEWKEQKATTKFKDGRGGRVQCRIIGELPFELSVIERADVLAEFTQEFDKRKLPYIAVMHAPDHTNDKRNWHFHLIYYDRPCSVLDTGEWDFTATEEKKDKSGSKWISHPHRQNKLREMRGEPWIRFLRERLAEISNDHLARAGEVRRLDPRKYSEMGIHRDSQDHLGSKLWSMETLGVATPHGYNNANREFDSRVRALEKARDKKLEDNDAMIEKLRETLEAGVADDAQLRLVWSSVAQLKNLMDDAAELTFQGSHLALMIERQKSRAEKVKDVCERETASLRHGDRRLHEKMQINRYEERRLAALSHLREVEASLANEIALAAHLSKQGELLSGAALARISALVRSATLTREDQRRREPADNGRQAIVEMDHAPADLSERPKPMHDRRQPSAVTQTEFDSWLERIVAQRRRLIKAGGGISPANKEPSDARFLDSDLYSASHRRLAGIKSAQDQIVDEVVIYIQKNPGCVRRLAPGSKPPLALSCPRPAWAEAFEAYQADEAIALAVNVDLARQRVAQQRQADAAARSVDVRQNGEDVRGALPQQPVHEPKQADATAPAAAVAPRKPSLPSLNHVLDRLYVEGHRLQAVDGKVVIDEVQRRSLDALHIDFDRPAIQKRLRGIRDVQQAELRRLIAYARLHPDGVIDLGSHLLLGPKSPDDLISLASKWAYDQQSNAEIRAAVEVGRNNAWVRTSKRDVPESEEADSVGTTATGDADEQEGRKSPTRRLPRPVARTLLSNPGEDSAALSGNDEPEKHHSPARISVQASRLGHGSNDMEPTSEQSPEKLQPKRRFHPGVPGLGDDGIV